MASVRLFISAVSGEFGPYREALRRALTRHNVEVKIQEDFAPDGRATLVKLDEYIQKCDAVIHLVGDQTGADAVEEDVEAIFASHPDLDLPGLREQGPFSYTQWEAYLALYYRLANHEKRLIVATRVTGPTDPGQSAHLARLARMHSYPEIHFQDAGGLSVEVLRSLVDLLARAGGDDKPTNLPYASLGKLFKGRDAFLERVRTAFGSAGAASVHGLGGIGKTRAAIEYGLRYAHEYTALLFVRADSPEGLKESLAGLCGPLVLNLPEREATDLEVQVAAALQWLQRHPGWFLILDNADSEDAARAVEELLGRLSGAGHVLITSRLSNWSGGVESLALDVLTVEAATEFLLERTAARRRTAPDDLERAGELAVALGQLALALEQAGAMVSQKRLAFAGYLEQWNSRHDEVLGWFDERQMRYPMSIAVTWQTSFAQLSDRGRKLLELLSWFAPDPVPESLLDVPIPGLGWTAEDAKGALEDLESFSLVTRPQDSPVFSIHRLVQDVTRSRISVGEREASLSTALRWLNAGFVGDPQDVRTWPTLLPLVSHALACSRAADEAGIADPTAHLMNQVGILEQCRARYSVAEPLTRRALEIDEQSYGPDHPLVARDLNNLAGLLKATNRVATAEPLLRRALKIHERRYGPDHPRVAISLSNLAQLLRATNRLTEAEPLYGRALEIDERSLGPDHPSVARDLNNLAGLLKATNRLAEAEALYRRALGINELSYGPDHPRVATDLNSLAGLLQDTNRMAEAEPLMRRALEIDERSYGPDHPRVATDLNNLARLLHAANRLTESEPLMRRALRIDERSLGPDHPDVGIDLNNLAQFLKATNRPAEAEPLMRRALSIDESSCGPDHPNVARDLSNLASLLYATNRLAEAEPLMRRALEIDERSYGPDHPDVATALNNLAQLLQATNRLAEVEPLMRRALEIDERSYGPDHPKVAIDLNNLARLLQDTNRLAEAEPLMRRALGIVEASMGTDHPNTAVVRDNLNALLEALANTKGDKP